METILLPAQAASVTKRSRAIALGYFDGVHIGHRAVLARALYDYGGTVPAVFTFDALAGKPEGGLLTTAAEREALLAAAGIEELFEAEFQKFAGLSPEQFVDRILRELLTAAVVCCGEDFRFGAGAAGDVALLKKLATAAGIGVVTVPPVLADGVPVSASRIRRLIAAGEMRQANRLLGYPYTLRSEVAYGRQLGRTLGTPTINQPLPAGKAAPKFGVYAAAVAVPESGEWRVASLFCGKRGEGIDSAAIKSNQKSAGTIMGGVCNIGVKPTVGAAAPIAETWIENFTGNLYGMTVPVTPVVYLRAEQRFDSIERLKEQILTDSAAADRIFNGGGTAPAAVLFDLDDTLIDRTVAFAGFCDYFLWRYFPQLPCAEKAERKAWMEQSNNHGYVPYLDYFGELVKKWGWASPPPVPELEAEFRLRFPEYTVPFPESAGVLAELRRRGFPVGVVTNGPSRQQHRKLDVSGLRPLLDIAVVSADERVHKPEPEIFRRAAAWLGVPAVRCWYVGDHPANDISGAAAAGMKPVYFNSIGREAIDGVETIYHLNALLDLLS